jgi:hypothetical protein
VSLHAIGEAKDNLPVGMALQSAATRVNSTVSVAERPEAKAELAADQVETVTKSESQYWVKVHPVHVHFSGGTGSWSIFKIKRQSIRTPK